MINRPVSCSKRATEASKRFCLNGLYKRAFFLWYLNCIQFHIFYTLFFASFSVFAFHAPICCERLVLYVELRFDRRSLSVLLESLCVHNWNACQLVCTICLMYLLTIFKHLRKMLFSCIFIFILYFVVIFVFFQLTTNNMRARNGEKWKRLSAF